MLAESPAMPASSYRYRPSLANRLGAIVAAAAVCALIVLMLIRMGLLVPPIGVAEKLTAITFRPQGTEHSEKPAAAKAEQRRERQVTVQPRETPLVKPQTVPPVTVPLIQVSREQFASSYLDTSPVNHAYALRKNIGTTYQ